MRFANWADAGFTAQREHLTAAVVLKPYKFNLQEKVTFYDPKSSRTEL